MLSLPDGENTTANPAQFGVLHFACEQCEYISDLTKEGQKVTVDQRRVEPVNGGRQKRNYQINVEYQDR